VGRFVTAKHKSQKIKAQQPGCSHDRDDGARRPLVGRGSSWPKKHNLSYIHTHTHALRIRKSGPRCAQWKEKSFFVEVIITVIINSL
jgi:hypothetical protein